MCKFGEEMVVGDLLENERTRWIECKIPKKGTESRVEIKISQNSGRKWTKETGKLMIGNGK